MKVAYPFSFATSRRVPVGGVAVAFAVGFALSGCEPDEEALTPSEEVEEFEAITKAPDEITVVYTYDGEPVDRSLIGYDDGDVPYYAGLPGEVIDRSEPGPIVVTTTTNAAPTGGGTGPTTGTVTLNLYSSESSFQASKLVPSAEKKQMTDVGSVSSKVTGTLPEAGEPTAAQQAQVDIALAGTALYNPLRRLIIYDDNIDNFQGSWSVGTRAWMPFTWNNRTSRHFDMTILGTVVIYDRSFFRRRLAVLFRWGWQDTPYIRELAFLDNRMSSVYLL